MVLKIGDHCVDVNILNMNSDRNCMFYALVHQLQYVKVNSNEHMEATIRLRQCVIEEIENNFDKYKQALKVRLCYNNGTNEIKQNVSDDECQEFISTNLTKDRFWGGQETIMAVSNIFSVNILTFNENGPFCLSSRFNPSYARTIFLAYRVGGVNEKEELTYNHYDSVCGLSEQLLYRCAFDLAEQFDKSVNIDHTL